MLVEHRFGDAPGRRRGVPGRRRAVACSRCATARSALPLAPARDFKRIGEGDTGPNTGGMGAYSPVEGADAALDRGRPRARSCQPVVDELARRGTPFHGVLYAGLMLTADGPEGARVQRPLRRSRRRRSCSRACSTDLLDLLPARGAARRTGGRRARVGRARGGHRRARLARLSGRRRPRGDVISGLEDAGARGHPRRHGRARRRDRHRRRPRAERDRARRRIARPPAPPRMLPPT